VTTVAGIRPHAASFRDPAGYVFEHAGEIFRAVHPEAVEDVEALFSSGLHDTLVDDGLLVRHRRATPSGVTLPAGWLVLQADRLPVISYASEWTDAQLQAAGELTIELQRRALHHGLSLKDATAFNVQFVGSRPVFLDVLSFTRLESSGTAWPAYRQFCQQFLAPLALRRYVPDSMTGDIGLDGVSLQLASRSLPARTWLMPGLALHVHLHARMASTRPNPARRHAGGSGSATATVEFRLRLADSLASVLRRLGTASRASHWTGYRQNNVYSDDAAVGKRRFVEQVARQSGARRAVDLGANDGHYARALADLGIACTAVEVDAACCELIYGTTTASPYDRLVNTLRVDLTNPTPAHGWAHEERASFVERMRCDLTLSLALVHHLAITHQIPFGRIARFLAQLAPDAIVEYVPPQDPMVQQLLAARTGITPSFLHGLSEECFQAAFDAHFTCAARSMPLEGRVLYHFKQRR